MKTKFSVLRSKGIVAKSLFTSSVFLIATSAHAALPAWATTMVSDASDNVTSVFALIGPVVGVAIASGLVIKLVKRGASKI